MVQKLAAIVGLCLIASTADAQNAQGEGSKLFEEGRALAADKKYVEACAKFEKSLELDPAPGTKLNFGDCHEHLGHLAQAYRLFMEVAEADNTANADRAKYAKGRADALVPKLGTLVVKIADPSAVSSITIGGRVVPTASEIEEKVDPGDVTVEAKLQSGPPFKQTAAAKAGATITIDVTSSPVIAPPGGGGPSTEPADGAERRHTRLIYAFTAGGFGVAGMVTGGVVGLLARSKYREQFDNMNCSNESPPRCNPTGFEAQTSAVTMGNVATVFFVGGAVLVATGAVLYLTAPKADGDLVVTPTASPTGAGLTVVGTF